MKGENRTQPDLKFYFGFLKNNNVFYISLFVVILFCSLISYENITFGLYFNSIYQEYGSFLKTLDSGVFSNPKTTFPMWGYGFIHLLGKNILLVLIIQQLITFFTLIYLDIFINKFSLINRIFFFRFCILLSTPWFFYHTQMWPKSISSNLFLIGVILMFEYYHTLKSNRLLLSSIAFGFLHNFRSDYFYLSIVLVVITFFISKKKSFKTFLFPLIQYIMLIPWMVFTFHQTGKILPTSSNTGHVFFIGLGQLPNNVWDITPVDEDPTKNYILSQQFGSNFNSCNYEEGEFLKSKFIEYVSNEPFEWIKKCFYSFRLLILDPFYVGNVGNFQQNKISNIEQIRALENYIYKFDFKEGVLLIKDTQWAFSAKEAFQILVTVFTKILGVFLFLTFLILLVFTFYKFGLKIFNNPIDFILLIIILYQIAISIFAFHMPVYNNSIFIFYLLMTARLFQKYLSIRQ